MTIRNPHTHERVTSSGQFEALVSSLVPDTDTSLLPSGVVVPPEPSATEIMVNRALDNAKKAREQEDAGVGHWATKPDVVVVETDDDAPEDANEPLPSMIRGAMSAQTLSGGRVEEVRDSAWGDLGGGHYTYWQNGDLNPNSLPDIKSILDMRWDPSKRRRVSGTRVILGNRSIFVDELTDEPAAIYQRRVHDARKELQGGGGFPFVPKAKRKDRKYGPRRGQAMAT